MFQDVQRITLKKFILTWIKASKVGIAGLMNDHQFNLVPEGLTRIDRRKEYQDNPEHQTLKDKREKRDELKEKKFQAQMKKETPNTTKSKDENQGGTTMKMRVV